MIEPFFSVNVFAVSGCGGLQNCDFADMYFCGFVCKNFAGRGVAIAPGMTKWHVRKILQPPDNLSVTKTRRAELFYRISCFFSFLSHFLHLVDLQHFSKIQKK